MTFVELRALLTRDARVPACVVRKLLTYALGRGLSDDDQQVVQEIAAKTSANEHRVHDLIAQVVMSRPFREEP